MRIAYSKKSQPSAELLTTALEELGERVNLVRSSNQPSDINWGRSIANTELNRDISTVTNKRIMRNIFSENGEVPIPKLYNLGMYSGTELMLAVRQGSLIGRPDQHSKGRGLWKCDTMDDIKKALRGTRKKKPATHFMEYIIAPREYRVHIFKEKSIRISEKDFGNSGTTNAGNYTTKKPEHNIKHVRKAAKKAVKAVGLDFGAVDILADDNNCWVLEVNAAPHLGGTLPQLYAKKFMEVAR